MSEEFHLGYWGPRTKLTTVRLVIIKPKPERRAGATNILYATNGRFQQIHNIWRVTIKQMVYPIFPAIYVRMKMLTITHDITHLTTRFTTTRTSLLTSPPISLIIQPSPNKYVLKVLRSPKCYQRWLRKHFPMLLRICEHRMESPCHLAQTIECWMVCCYKWYPFPPPLGIGPIFRICQKSRPIQPTYPIYLYIKSTVQLKRSSYNDDQVQNVLISYPKGQLCEKWSMLATKIKSIVYIKRGSKFCLSQPTTCLTWGSFEGLTLRLPAGFLSWLPWLNWTLL